MGIEKEKIKILHLATYSHGGAGTATVIFNNYLRDAGYHSVILALNTNGNTPGVIQYKIKKGGFSFFRYRQLKQKYKSDTQRWNELFRANSYSTRVAFDDQKSMATARDIIKQAGFTPDVIFLHWTNNFITPEIIAELHQLTNARIVGIMMDNAIFTGGCHYPFDCEGYTTGCKECPMFKAKTSLPAEIMQRKIASFPEDMEMWGTTTDCRRAEKSLPGQNRKITPILFPINTELLPTASKEEIREEYGIKRNRKLVLLGCTSFNGVDNRKGFEYLTSILTLIKERAPELPEEVSLVVVGEQNSRIFEHLGYNVIKLGFIPLKELMKVFKMCDLFVSTSIEDSGPLMVNQAIAMGTPVAAFGIGVAEDLVKDGKTGAKAELFDCDTLSDKIIELLKSDRDFKTGCLQTFEQQSREMSPLAQLERIINERTTK